MRRGWTLVESLVVLGVLALAAALFVPSWLESRRTETYWNACGGIRPIREGEDALRTLDLDGNRKQDYWCRDIRGLAQFTSKGVPLIEDRLAAADGALADPRPWFEHLFKMLEVDEEGRPFADSTGFGPRYDYCMYPAREGRFKFTIYYKDCDQWGYHGRNPLSKALEAPASMGWCRFD